jgi:hypothetical protein
MTEHTPESCLVKTDVVLPLIRIPTNLLGKVLDQGKASAYAAHLLAIKCSKGPGFVLNEKHVAREYGISKRPFLAGLRTLDKTKVLARSQPNHRAYAVETIAPASDRYVLIGESFLGQPSSVVAFILAANLSPDVFRPDDIAKRIGVKSRMTIRKLTKLAKELNAIASDTAEKGKVLLARRGHKFDPAKNDTAKIDTAKNDTAHSILEESTDSGSLSNLPAMNLRQGTLSGESGPSDDDLKEKDEGLIILHNWRSCQYAKELGLDYFPPEIDETPFVVGWRAMLDWQGTHPAHLRTHNACRQAVDLAMFLNQQMDRDDTDIVLEAISFHACRAHARGKVVRSLGFIAQELIRSVENDDDTAIYDIPTRLREEEFTQAATLAHKAVSALESFETSLNRRALLSTQRVEELAGYIERYGRDVVVDTGRGLYR